MLSPAFQETPIPKKAQDSDDFDSQWFDEVVKRHRPWLVALAREHISARLRQRMDPESVAQSALDSFYNGIREGRLHNGSEEDLAGLLATITLRKIRQKVTFHKALKRSIDREQELPHAEEDPSPQLWALARELSPFINLAFKEES